MNKTIKKWIFIFGFGGLFGCTFTLLLTFFTAYFNGYEVLVTINDYNEAKIEFYLFLFLIPCIIYTLAISLDNYVKNELQKGNNNT